MDSVFYVRLDFGSRFLRLSGVVRFRGNQEMCMNGKDYANHFQILSGVGLIDNIIVEAIGAFLYHLFRCSHG